jgi:hypothetical protein
MNYLRRIHLSRRALLRGTGTALALPLLESMFPAATAWSQTRAAPKTRLACIYIPHGAVMSRWTPAAEGADFEFPQILKPLEPYRDRVNVISDFSLPLAYGSDASAGANPPCGARTASHPRDAAHRSPPAGGRTHGISRVRKTVHAHFGLRDRS